MPRAVMYTEIAITVLYTEVSTTASSHYNRRMNAMVPTVPAASSFGTASLSTAVTVAIIFRRTDIHICGGKILNLGIFNQVV
jgi:hypothetical protein